MMKYLSLLIIALYLTSLSSAQTIFQVGPKAGANLGKIEGAGFSDNYTLGYHAGGFFDIGLNKKWSMMGELLFNQINSDTASGFNAIYNNLTRQDFQNPKLNYLSIPLLLSFKPGKTLSFHAGAQYGILIDKSKDVVANGESAFKNGDLSVLAGIQVHVLGFRIYGRYAIGLNNINDLSNSKEWKTTALQVGLALELL